MPDINDLPVEVLGHIFTLVTEGERDNLPSLHPKTFWGGKSCSLRAPVVFLGVCGHWRAVAQATPLLWTPLDATMRNFRTGALLPAEALQYWLSMSQSATLELFLKGSYGHIDPKKKELVSAHAVAMLRVLADEAHRWRSVSLELDHHLAEVLVDMLLNQFNPGSLLLMNRLQIVAYRERGAQIPLTDLGRAIGIIKSLKELSLVIKFDYDMTSLLRDIPCGQLTTVHLDTVLTLHQVISLLSQSRAVVTASFNFVHYVPISQSNLQRSTLAHLTKLVLSGSADALHIFDCFDLPSLERLELAMGDCSNWTPLESLTTQPSISIRRFGFYFLGRRLPPAVLVSFLRIRGLHRVPRVEVSTMDLTIHKVVEEAVAQLRDDIPGLWIWGRYIVGWKPRYDDNDRTVTRVIPVPMVVS